jgi:Sulfotransferase family
VVSNAADASLRLAEARHNRRAHFNQLVRRRGDRGIGSWSDFYSAVGDGPFLAKLDDYPAALLIAGCDWSATTAITRLFKRLSPFADASWGHDDELDGALLLAGRRARRLGGRNCFQTTYVRDRYREYFAHDDFKLVWIVREPRAAVRSLLATRGRALPARNALGLSGKSAGGQSTSRLEKACATYLASIRQTTEIKERLGERVAVVDYDELATDRERLLPALCRFAGVRCDAHALRHLHGKSVRKGSLAAFEAAIVDQLAQSAYRRASAAATLSVAHG